MLLPRGALIAQAEVGDELAEAEDEVVYLLAHTTTAFALASPTHVAPVVPTMCKTPIPSTQ
jgi:hypothetical protein